MSAPKGKPNGGFHCVAHNRWCCKKCTVARMRQEIAEKDFKQPRRRK